MPNYLERRDRWGNSVALWVLFGMILLIPGSLWALRSVNLENEVHQWIPHGDPQYQAYQFAEQHFSTEDAILVTWEGSSLEDPRIDRLTRKIRGNFDPSGRRRGASPYFSSVRTPYDLIHQIHTSKVSPEEAIDRVTGVLLGKGPVRIRLTAEGRDRKERFVRTLEANVASELGVKLIVKPATSFDHSNDEDESATASGDEQSPTESVDVAEAPLDNSEAPAEPGAEDLDEEGLALAKRESSLKDLAAILPPQEPHDYIVSWAGMHWNPTEVEKFQQLVSRLDSVGGEITPATTESPVRPVVEATFQTAGSPAAIAVYLSEAGIAERGIAIRWLRQAAIDSGVAESQLHLAGSPIAGQALNDEVMRAAWDKSLSWSQPHRKSLFLLSSVVGGLIALWMLKSWRLAIAVLGVSYFTTLVSMALVPLSGTSMNMVLVVMPTLLLVTTLSVAVHIANYWKHAAAANPRTAVAHSVKTAYGPVLWAGFTSIIGQASLCVSSLAPIREFGIFSTIGTAISLVVTLIGLPALMLLFPAKAPVEEELDDSFWHGLAAWVARHQIIVNCVCLLATIGCSIGLFNFRTETKVVRYFSEPSQTFQDYAYIEQNLGGIVPVDILVRFDKEAQSELKFLQRRDLVRDIETQLRALPGVSGALSLSDFLPDIQQATEGQGSRRRQQQRFAAQSRVIESRVKGGRYPGAESLLTVCDVPSELNAEGDELWRITAQVAVLSDLSYSKFQAKIDAICSSVLSAASGQSREKLPTDVNVRAYRPYASHLVTGLVPLFMTTQDQLLTGFITSFGGAFLTIAIVVMIYLRHPVAGILAMIPNVLPIVAVFGVISWMGVRIDIGSTVTASIALGITIDGTLHLVTWFKQGIEQGKSRADAVAQALGHCGPAMWQTTLIVSLGLVVLYPCDLVLISRFGWLMAVLLAAASISDLILTPALLAGPLGYLIEKCTTVHTRASETASEKPVVASAPDIPRGSPPAPHIDQRRIRISRPE